MCSRPSLLAGLGSCERIEDIFGSLDSVQQD